MRISAQDSIVNFTRDVQFQVRRGHCTLAVFLNVQQAYHRVRVDALIHCLSTIGLTRHITTTRDLHNYLTGGTFPVNLGSIRRSSRPLMVGIPQGSTLSPIVFNVALADTVPTSPRGGITITTTRHVDDQCIWADSTQMRLLTKVIQAMLDDLSAKLERVGLRIAIQKSKFMVQNPPPKYLPKTTLTVL